METMEECTIAERTRAALLLEVDALRIQLEEQPPAEAPPPEAEADPVAEGVVHISDVRSGPT